MITGLVLVYVGFFHWRSLSHVVSEGVGRVFEESAKEGKAVKISERYKGHLMQHVCLLKIQYCPNFPLFVTSALRNTVSR